MGTRLIQWNNPYFSEDCGMGYVVCLPDGRFLLLDGGIGEYDETEQFFRYLETLANGRPVIAAWFFSHAHPDHIGLFCQFAERYAEKAEIQKVCWRWPSPDRCPGVLPCPIERFEAAAKRLKETGTRLTTLETGQTFAFPDCSVEVLCTEADLQPGIVRNLNEISAVFRMTLCGKTILFTGDIQELGSAVLCKKYAPADLKCDVIQVGHHGYYGGSDELYRAADPSILLWPCPDYWFHVVRLSPTNRYLVSSSKVEHTLVGGQGRYSIAFPSMTVTREAPVTMEKETLLETDFSEKSVTKLGWACLRGGNTQYAPALPSFPESGGLRLNEKSGQNCVCAILKPDELMNKKTIDLRLDIGNAGEDTAVGFMWDSPTPTVWEEDRVLWGFLKSGERATLRLTVDCREKTAILQKDGVEASRYRCREPLPFGMHLCFRNADVILHSVLVT